MSNFKVTKIIDADTIQVQPSWAFVDDNGAEITSNEVAVFGIDKMVSDEYAKHILQVLLINKEVQLVNPAIRGVNKVGKPKLVCTVLIDNTDISYYFSESVSSKPQRELA